MFDLINTLSKQDWDGICNIIETTGKAAGIILTGMAAYETAKAFSNNGDKNEEALSALELLEKRIAEAKALTNNNGGI
mgnify:CR=1 FL=1